MSYPTATTSQPRSFKAAAGESGLDTAVVGFDVTTKALILSIHYQSSCRNRRKIKRDAKRRAKTVDQHRTRRAPAGISRRISQELCDDCRCTLLRLPETFDSPAWRRV